MVNNKTVSRQIYIHIEQTNMVQYNYRVRLEEEKGIVVMFSPVLLCNGSTGPVPVPLQSSAQPRQHQGERLLFSDQGY